ncbi:MAG: HepT-like ribonuclease domain-containing protein [Streptosporangiales bacterium]
MVDAARLRFLLERMAGFRDLLVHGYARVDDEGVVELLHTRLGDLEAFRRSIAEHTMRSAGP